PAFKSKYLQATIDSLLAQDFSNYEIIVGDDCPTNEVFNLFKKFVSRNAQIKNFRYYRNENPMGGGDNLFHCISKARGRYIKPVFDDDILLPKAISRFVQVLSQNERLSVVGSRR